MMERSVIEKTIKGLFEKKEVNNESTLREVRAKVAADLEVDVSDLHEEKEMIKDVLIKMLEIEEENIKKFDENTEDPRLKQLKSLGTAMKLGPTLYRGLANLELEEKVIVLRSRLREKGAVFKGDLPTKKEIAAAKAKRQRDDDLEDIDTSNILVSTKRARRSETKPSAGSSSDDDNSSDDGASSSSHDDQREEPSLKKEPIRTKIDSPVIDNDSEQEFEF